MAKAEKPLFKKQVVMLDGHLFSINPEGWKASIATGRGRVELKLLHGTYHEKFKSMKAGQAWLLKARDGLSLKAVFSKTVSACRAELEGDSRGRKREQRSLRLHGARKQRKDGAGHENCILPQTQKAPVKAQVERKTLLAKYRGREHRRLKPPTTRSPTK